MSKKYVKTPKLPKYCVQSKGTSDSDESTASSVSDTPSTGSMDQLSIVAEFDEIMRAAKQRRCDEVENAFTNFARLTKGIAEQWSMSLEECKRLQGGLAKSTNDYSDLECKLVQARKLLDQERKRLRRIEEERDDLDRKVKRVVTILYRNHNCSPDETVKDLSFLKDENFFGVDFNGLSPRLSAIQEVNTTGSLMSDLSYSRSEDDLDVSLLAPRYSGAYSKKRISEIGTQPPPKKRRSTDNKVVEINLTDTVRATTTLMVNKDGPITATSIIESVPADIKQDFKPSAPPAHLFNDKCGTKNPNVVRQHNFQTRTLVMPETCGPCNKRVGFGRTIYKCKECRAICHPECKNLLPLPCTPLVNTPLRGTGLIGDYTPMTSPMVPALIVHCTKEVENRGCNELGVYRISASEKEVKALKEKFLRGKTAPCINQVDIHVICGTIKDFLRSLHEPLITAARWRDFVTSVKVPNHNEIAPLLHQIISELPQPNRDTLSFMILHLKRVAEMPECKMPVQNLAKVFAPTIIGYSSSDLDRAMLLDETRQQGMVMEALMNMSTEFWESFLESSDVYQTPSSKLQQTPSTDSLLFPKRKGIFSPYGIKSTIKKKQKFFPTP